MATYLFSLEESIYLPIYLGGDGHPPTYVGGDGHPPTNLGGDGHLYPLIWEGMSTYLSI